MGFDQYSQVEFLLNNFEQCLDAFDRYCPFSGEQIDSHLRTLRFVRKAQHPTDVLDDPAWYVSLVDTLRTWCMDARGADLADPATIRESFAELRPAIAEIEGQRLEELDPYSGIDTELKVWRILEHLKVGKQRARLVVNSKALHHLLPDLVPPMDRAYTFTFFYLNPNAVQNRAEKKRFSEMWPVFARIAREKAAVAQRYLGRGMHTSIPKIIDNAIVGCLKLLVEKNIVKAPDNQT